MAAPNKSLREKGAARLMAVQLAYSYHLQHKAPNAASMLADIDAYKRADEDPEFSKLFKEKPHAPTLNKLLTGYAEHKEVLEAVAVERLSENWKSERVNPLLLILLQLAILELDHHRELKDTIIVGEYTDMAARLLDAGEVDFLHACLKLLSDKLRS